MVNQVKRGRPPVYWSKWLNAVRKLNAGDRDSAGQKRAAASPLVKSGQNSSAGDRESAAQLEALTSRNLSKSGQKAPRLQPDSADASAADCELLPDAAQPDALHSPARSDRVRPAAHGAPPTGPVQPGSRAGPGGGRRRGGEREAATAAQVPLGQSAHDAAPMASV